MHRSIGSRTANKYRFLLSVIYIIDNIQYDSDEDIFPKSQVGAKVTRIVTYVPVTCNK